MSDQEKSLYEKWMRRCIELGHIAKARGDSPVGSVIIQNGEIIAEGIEAGKTKQDITCHAEVEAIREARKKWGISDFSDCILVTTHEPCLLCSYLIRHHQFKKIVVGVTTGEIGGFSSELPILKDQTIKRWAAPPEMVFGILEKECLEL